MFTRFFAGLGVLVSLLFALALLGCVAGIWMYKGQVTAKANHKFETMTRLLDQAVDALERTETSLRRATERLSAARAEQQRLAAEPLRGAGARRMLARTLHQQIAPEVTDAQAALRKIAETAFVVNSILEDARDWPGLGESVIDLAGLEQVNGRIGALSNSAWDVSRLFERPETELDQEAVEECQSRVARTLQAIKEIVLEQRPRVGSLRERTLLAHTMFQNWATPVAVLATAALLWLAFSQICLLRRCWLLCFRRRATAP